MNLLKIQGLSGIYLVKDKMQYQWLNRIDQYIKKAKEWGRKKLTIQYAEKKNHLSERN